MPSLSELEASHSLWNRPTAALPWTFALGAFSASSSLGVFAMVAEARGGDLSSLPAPMMWAPFVSAILWAGCVHLELGNRPALFLGPASIASFFLSGIGILMTGIAHTPSSLYPKTSVYIAPFLGIALAGSFVPILSLARSASRGEPEATPLDASAAACVWAAAVAAMGLLVAPGLFFRVLCAGALLAALVGLFRVKTLTKTSFALANHLRRGGAIVAAIAFFLVPVRLVEQARTRNPAIIAVYKRGIASVHCEVRPDGREGDVSLWLVDCGSNVGPRVGWDETKEAILQDEELFARVPRLRSVAPFSTR